MIWFRLKYIGQEFYLGNIPYSDVSWTHSSLAFVPTTPPELHCKCQDWSPSCMLMWIYLLVLSFLPTGSIRSSDKLITCFFLQHFLLLFRTPHFPLLSYLTGYAFSGSFVESSKFYWLLNIGVLEDSVLRYRLNIQLPEASHGPFKLKMPKIRLWFFFLPFVKWHIHPSSCWDQILWSHPSLFPTSISNQQILPIYLKTIWRFWCLLSSFIAAISIQDTIRFISDSCSKLIIEPSLLYLYFHLGLPPTHTHSSHCDPDKMLVGIMKLLCSKPSTDFFSHSE